MNTLSIGLLLIDSQQKEIKQLKRNIRKYKNMRQIDLAKLTNFSRPLISLYETKNSPSLERLLKFSKVFNISIHALITGEKLFFNFNDKYFGKTILLADQLLSLENQKMLITLMESVLKNNPKTIASH